MPRDEPSFIVAPGECDELGAQFLDGFEPPHPEQVLLQGSDEALGDAIALGLNSKTASRPDYYQFLLTGGNPHGHDPDPRIWYDGQGASSLPPGVYQLTNTTHAPYSHYDSYGPSPVHRLFQMWQDLHCSVKTVTAANPSGCLNGLFAWVEATVGSGSNGAAPPSGGYTGEGSTAPQFFNIQAGDAPYFKSLADNYTMSDNYHQPVMGGTGANPS